jgi:hypothetical protein
MSVVKTSYDSKALVFAYLHGVMSPFIDSVVARGILKYAFQWADLQDVNFELDGIPRSLVREIEKGVDLFVEDRLVRLRCQNRLRQTIGERDFHSVESSLVFRHAEGGGDQ